MKKIAMSPNDWELIKNYLLGGAAIGGGAGLATALVNHLQGIRKDEEMQKKDPNTLVLNLRTPQAKMASMRGGTAIVGALLAGGASYAAVRALHQAIKKKQMQQELDNAQNAYIDVVGQEKEASALGRKPMQPLETLSSAPVAATMLVALASAAVANQALRKSFPDKKPPTRLTPKRVVIRRQDDADPEPEAETIVPLDQQTINKEAAANELLVRCVQHLPGAYDVRDLVTAAAHGRIGELTKVAFDLSSDSMFDVVKGASLEPASQLRENIAVTALMRSPIAAPLAVVAAGEFADHSPSLFKLAAALPEETQEALVKYAAEVTDKYRQAAIVESLEPLVEKNASVAPEGDVVEVLKRLLQQQDGLQQQDIPGILDRGDVNSATSEDSTEANAPLTH